MRLAAIGHILHAAAGVTGERRFVVVGSASILLRCRGIPADMLLTPEIDLYAPGAPDVEAASDAIDGAIGQGSAFHREFGYHGDGVSPGTARMPSDWPGRVAEVSLAGVLAIVPDPNDIALSKLAAWRGKDRAWLLSGARARILSLPAMAGRLADLPDAPEGSGMAGADELARRLRSLAAEAGIEVPVADHVAPGRPAP